MNKKKRNNFISVFGLLILLTISASLDAQRVISVYRPVVPVLTQKEINPVLSICLVNDTKQILDIKKLTLSLSGTSDLKDIDTIAFFLSSGKGSIDPKQRLASSSAIRNHTKLMISYSLKPGDTCKLWVSIRLRNNIDLLHKIGIEGLSVTTNKGKIVIPKATNTSLLRVGVAVRQANQDGVNTSRIPCLERTNDGVLIAAYDARYDNSRDLQGHMDIALNRSLDNGRTWLPIQIGLNMKTWGGLPERFNGVSDACLLVDRSTNEIFLAGLWMYGVFDYHTGKWIEGLDEKSKTWNHQWRGKGSQPGLDVKETAQFLITKSSDNGATWSNPINITSTNKRPEWWLYAPAPGHGITLKDGTLVMPTQGRDSVGMPFSNITWSKDHGKTWTTSNPAYSNTTECMAVELDNGTVMLNMRDNQNAGNPPINGRRVCVTNDFGTTWTEHPFSRKVLIEPVCMASIHRHEYKDNRKKSILLFSNPNSKTGRHKMTIKASLDNGESWLDKNTLLLDEGYGFGYSCLTSISDEIVGILYEGSGAQLIFQQIPIQEIISQK